MNGRHRTLARGAFAVSAALSAVAVVFLVLAIDVPSLPNEFGPKGFAIAFALSLGGMGGVVASRRPENPIGWIFCVVGLFAGARHLSAQ